jgi:hypothetical protein
MTRIHIARDRQSLGQFSPQEVAEGLASGKFLPTDLGWREPMEQWMPLSEFTDLPQVADSIIPPALPEALPEEQPEPAWERRGQIGMFSALAQTVRQVLSVPVATFKAMKRSGGLLTPWFFFLIVTTLTSWVAMGYQFVVVLMNPEAMLGPLAKNLSTTALVGVQILSMALVPIVMIIVPLCAAGILHLVFLMLGNNGQSFEVIFRSYCYAVAPASVFRLIPICGDILFFVAALVLLVFALRETLRVDGVRATIGVVLPALLCCGFFWAGVVLAGGALSQGLPK